MANQVYMDIPAVRNVAQQFQTFHDVLTAVNQALQTLSTILKASSFIGFVGAAIAAFIDMIRPYVKQIADKCGELSKDLKASVTAYENGDAQGATKFY